jgi:hypothetical protein
VSTHPLLEPLQLTSDGLGEAYWCAPPHHPLCHDWSEPNLSLFCVWSCVWVCVCVCVCVCVFMCVCLWVGVGLLKVRAFLSVCNCNCVYMVWKGCLYVCVGMFVCVRVYIYIYIYIYISACARCVRKCMWVFVYQHAAKIGPRDAADRAGDQFWGIHDRPPQPVNDQTFYTALEALEACLGSSKPLRRPWGVLGWFKTIPTSDCATRQARVNSLWKRLTKSFWDHQPNVLL